MERASDLRSNPTTLDEDFSLARATEARFTDLQLWELLRSNPTTLGEAFFISRITGARFEDKYNKAVDNNVGDQENPNVNDKQEVKKADDQKIENIKDEEGKNVVDHLGTSLDPSWSELELHLSGDEFLRCDLKWLLMTNEHLCLQGGDGGACKLLRWLLGDVIEVLEGASCTQRKVSMVPFVFSIPFVLSWGGSISSDSFLPSILLLVVIIITVVIVVVILIVVIVVIVGVVIVVVIIGVFVVVGGVSSILKLLFVIIGFLRRIVFYYLLHQPLGYGNGFLQSLRF
ncbi:hypothetical protein Tco_0966657 [Tanacetum coccineum]